MKYELSLLAASESVSSLRFIITVCGLAVIGEQMASIKKPVFSETSKGG